MRWIVQVSVAGLQVTVMLKLSVMETTVLVYTTSMMSVMARAHSSLIEVMVMLMVW